MLALAFVTKFKEKGHTRRSTPVYPKEVVIYLMLNLNGVKFGVKGSKSQSEPTSS